MDLRMRDGAAGRDGNARWLAQEASDLERIASGHFQAATSDFLLLVVQLIEAQIALGVEGLRPVNPIGISFGRQGKLVVWRNGDRLRFDNVRSSYTPLVLEAAGALRKILGPELRCRTSLEPLAERMGVANG